MPTQPVSNQRACRPTGRRITPARVRFRQIATNAELGEVSRSQLAVLADALPSTGLVAATDAALLRKLIYTAPDTAYGRDGTPIIFKSNRELAFEMGLSVSRISFLLSRLFDAGLIAMQDSANYRRHAVRNTDGAIVDACGIDLRILVARYAELAEIVRKVRSEQSAANAAIRRYRGGHRTLRLALQTPNDTRQSVLAKILQRAERIKLIVGTATKAATAILRRATAMLERLLNQAIGLPAEGPQEQQETLKTRYRHRKNAMHIQITNPYNIEHRKVEMRSAQAEQTNSYKAGSASKRALNESQPESDQPNNRQSAGLVALQDVLKALPALLNYGFARIRNWRDLVRLIPDLCRLCGISEDARNHAVATMGEQQAAIAIAIVLQKMDWQEIKSPGGYLRALTLRATSGNLHLTRSIFGLAARNPQEAIH